MYHFAFELAPQWHLNSLDLGRLEFSAPADLGARWKELRASFIAASAQVSAELDARL